MKYPLWRRVRGHLVNLVVDSKDVDFVKDVLRVFQQFKRNNADLIKKAKDSERESALWETIKSLRKAEVNSHILLKRFIKLKEKDCPEEIQQLSNTIYHNITQILEYCQPNQLSSPPARNQSPRSPSPSLSPSQSSYTLPAVPSPVSNPLDLPNNDEYEIPITQPQSLPAPPPAAHSFSYEAPNSHSYDLATSHLVATQSYTLPNPPAAHSYSCEASNGLQNSNASNYLVAERTYQVDSPYQSNNITYGGTQIQADTQEDGQYSDEEGGAFEGTELKYWRKTKKFAAGMKEIALNDDLESDRVDYKDEKLAKLKDYLPIIDEFHNTALVYAKMIITEKHLPNTDKKIQPITGIGIAGGTKFKVHDLFFKFPEDKKLSTQWLYGGSGQSDRIAGKATNHELKGLNHLLNADVEKRFNFPFIVLIDYQGFRQTILTEIPIDDSTLQYGSNNGGTTVYDSQEIQDYLSSREVSKRLNLKNHQVKTSKELILCTDIEIHKMAEREYWVLDYARILPPTAPSNYFNAIFFRLLRPEFLKSLPFDVSSDSYSSFQVNPQENSTADLATEQLFSLISSKFSNPMEIINFISDEDMRYVKNGKLNFSEIQPIDYFSRKLHQNGINIRFLGKIVIEISKCASSGYEKQIQKRITFLFSLMCIRILKNYWRELIQKEGGDNGWVHDICLSATTKVLTNLLNDETAFWDDTKLLQMMRGMFVTGIIQSDSDLLFDLFRTHTPKINFFFVALQFCQMCGIGLSEGTIDSLKRKQKFIVTHTNIQNFNAIIKLPPVISYYYALYLVHAAKSTHSMTSQIQYYKQAIIYIEYTLGFDYKTEHFRKLHDFVSFMNLKYDKSYPVHWANITKSFEIHQIQFCEFCEISPKVFPLWKFLQTPLTNQLHSQLVWFHPFGSMESVYARFEQFSKPFIKQCFEYSLEKEQYESNNHNNKDCVSRWNAAYNSSEHLEQLMKGLQFHPFDANELNIEDIQYWSIDDDKKIIFLFLNSFYLLDIIKYYPEAPQVRNLFGSYPMSKAIICDLYQCYLRKQATVKESPQPLVVHSDTGEEYLCIPLDRSKMLNDDLPVALTSYSVPHELLQSFEQEYLKSLFEIYFKLKIKDKLFENVISNLTESDYNSALILLWLQGTPGFSKDIVIYPRLARFNNLFIGGFRLGKSISTILENVKCNPFIRHVDFSRNELQDEDVRNILESLTSNNHLTSIDLSSNYIGYQGLQYIYEWVKTNTTITSILLSNNPIGEEGLQLLSVSPSVISVNQTEPSPPHPHQFVVSVADIAETSLQGGEFLLSPLPVPSSMPEPLPVLPIPVPLSGQPEYPPIDSLPSTYEYTPYPIPTIPSYQPNSFVDAPPQSLPPPSDMF